MLLAASLLLAAAVAAVAVLGGDGRAGGDPGSTDPSGGALTVGDPLPGADALPGGGARPPPGGEETVADGQAPATVPPSAGGVWLQREDAPLTAPAAHRAVWTGDALVAWGGDGRAAAYDLPQRRWRSLDAAPTGPVLGPVLVWTGTETLVWGGLRAEGGWAASGAALDHRDGTWRSLPDAPAALRSPVSAWTGRELLVWGAPAGDGAPGGGAGTGQPVGLALDPRNGAWRRLEDAPVASVQRSAGTWTGRELLVWGQDGSGERFTAAYEPGRGWRQLAAPPLSNPARAAAAWTGGDGGGELVLWGRELAGQRSSAPPAGAAFDPVADRWRLLPPAPGYDWTGSGWGAHGLRAAWTGELVLIVGGYPRSVTLAYEPATDSWQSLPELGGVIDPVLEWTGEFVSGTGVQRRGELLLWGGYGPYGPTTALRTWRTVGIGPTSDARLNVGLTRGGVREAPVGG